MFVFLLINVYMHRLLPLSQCKTLFCGNVDENVCYAMLHASLMKLFEEDHQR